MAMAESARWQDWGITVLRAVVGLVFAAHGGQKLFVMGLDAVEAFFGKLGIPVPAAAAVVVTLVELLGGLALILGVFVRWAAAPLAVNMLGAMLTVHLPRGFFLPDGIEFVLTLLAACLALVFLGGGRASLEARLRRPRR
jgi:putative oxidoreductase